jgi:hypothetical protein
MYIINNNGPLSMAPEHYLGKLKPKLDNLYISNNIWWSNASNALFRSKKTSPVIYLLSMVWSKVFVTCVRQEAVECSGRKPD